MAPKKRSAAEIERLKTVSSRVTRSASAKLLNPDSAPAESSKPVETKPKKQKKNGPKSKAAVPKAESPVPETESPVPETESPVPKAESPVPKVETPVQKVESQEPKAESPVPTKDEVGGAKTIVIEYCKQCTQFKRRAVRVKEALEKDVSGITVLLNPEKPRKGCFEVREEGGEAFITLLDMKRPFQPMRDLDMDEVIKNIIDKISSDK